MFKNFTRHCDINVKEPGTKWQFMKVINISWQLTKAVHVYTVLDVEG